jgi:hypothetical protein
MQHVRSGAGVKANTTRGSLEAHLLKHGALLRYDSQTDTSNTHDHLCRSNPLNTAELSKSPKQREQKRSAEAHEECWIGSL